MLQFTENRQRAVGLSVTALVRSVGLSVSGNPRVRLDTIGLQGPAGADGVGGVTDGDKGDIVVSGSGSVWTLDTVSPTKGGTGIANNAASTITISGSFGATFTLTALTSITLPTSGTLATLSNKLSAFAATSSAELKTVISDETGSGALVFANTPAMVTPDVGAATGASVVLTGTSATIIAAGRQGATDPVLKVDASTASVATGLSITGAAATGKVQVSVISSGTNEGLLLDAKGSGTIRLGATSTGNIEFSRDPVPTTSGTRDIGSTSLRFNKIWLGGGGIDFGSGDVTIINTTSNILDFAGAASGYRFSDGNVRPVAGQVISLGAGVSTQGWQNLYLNSTGTIDFGVGNAIITHSTGLLTSNVNIAVPDDAYDATTWNGSANVPTKNAVRDKIESIAAGTVTPPHCGRLTFVSSTAIKFAPYNGDQILIAGTFFSIPSAGIAGVANTSVFVNGSGGQNLAANTDYLVCAFSNSGTVTADFITTLTHTQATTAGNVGVEIKNGDNTRSVIGLIHTNGSSQFADAVGQRFVVSWFNWRDINLKGASTAGATTSSANVFVELATGARIEFVTFTGRSVSIGLTGFGFNNTAAGQCHTNIGFDGTTAASAQNAVQGLTVANDFAPAGVWVEGALADGYHYATPLGYVNVGTQTGTWFAALCGRIAG